MDEWTKRWKAVAARATRIKDDLEWMTPEQVAAVFTQAQDRYLRERPTPGGADLLVIMEETIEDIEPKTPDPELQEVI